MASAVEILAVPFPSLLLSDQRQKGFFEFWKLLEAAGEVAEVDWLGGGRQVGAAGWCVADRFGGSFSLLQRFGFQRNPLLFKDRRSE